MGFYTSERLNKRDMMADVTAAHGAPVAASMPARNTLDYTTTDGTRRVRLWHTDVVTVRPNGAVTLDTGGFNTMTTRDRINASGAARVYTERGVIHLSTDKGGIPFRESIYIGPRGAVRPDVTESSLDRDKRLLDSFMRHVRRKGLPSREESGGDPWVFHPSQVTPDVARDWMESNYFTRRLYVLALQKAGLTETGIAFHMAQDERNGIDRCNLGRIRRFMRAAIGGAA